MRSLLRALGADFSDIAGPDAPEISVKLAGGRNEPGVPSDVVKRIAARWTRGSWRMCSHAVSAGSWAHLLADRLRRAGPCMPRERSSVGASQRRRTPGAACVRGVRSHSAARSPPGRPGSFRTIRGRCASWCSSRRPEITLDAFVRWSGRRRRRRADARQGGFSAGAWMIGDQPVVVLKEAPPEGLVAVRSRARTRPPRPRARRRRGRVDLELRGPVR